MNCNIIFVHNVFVLGWLAIIELHFAHKISSSVGTYNTSSKRSTSSAKSRSQLRRFDDSIFDK